jgi:hypothetical protein
MYYLLFYGHPFLLRHVVDSSCMYGAISPRLCGEVVIAAEEYSKPQAQNEGQNRELSATLLRVY